MSKKEYYNLVMSFGLDFDDAFRLYEDLKDKDRQTIINTLCKEVTCPCCNDTIELLKRGREM